MFKFFIPLILSMCTLYADETALNESPLLEGHSYNYWGEFFNMLFTLAFVLILIVSTVWVLKRIMRSRVHNLNRTNGIKILERRPLNPKASLYLIDVLGQGIVISESPSGIHTIHTFSDDVKIEDLFVKKVEETETKGSLLFKWKKAVPKQQPLA